MSPGSLVNTTALRCFAAVQATRASTASGRFVPGSAATPNIAPMRRQSVTSGAEAHARHSGCPTFVGRSAAEDDLARGTVHSFRTALMEYMVAGSGRHTWARTGPGTTGRCGDRPRP